MYAKWNENKVYRPTRQNRSGTTVGSINYWKYCSITEPPRQQSLWIRTCYWGIHVPFKGYNFLLILLDLSLCHLKNISCMYSTQDVVKILRHLHNKHLILRWNLHNKRLILRWNLHNKHLILRRNEDEKRWQYNNVKSAIFQLYHGENNEMMMKPALY
jgi:hypothetical protein